MPPSRWVFLLGGESSLSCPGLLPSPVSSVPRCLRSPGDTRPAHFPEGLKNLENVPPFKPGFRILLTSFHCDQNGRHQKALRERTEMRQKVRGNEYALLGIQVVLLRRRVDTLFPGWSGAPSP